LTYDYIIPIIRSYAVSTAITLDSKIVLSRKGIPIYRDNGYFGVKPKGYDATIAKELRSFKLSIYSIFLTKEYQGRELLQSIHS